MLRPWLGPQLGRNLAAIPALFIFREKYIGAEGVASLEFRNRLGFYDGFQLVWSLTCPAQAVLILQVTRKVLGGVSSAEF